MNEIFIASGKQPCQACVGSQHTKKFDLSQMQTDEHPLTKKGEKKEEEKKKKVLDSHGNEKRLNVS